MGYLRLKLSSSGCIHFMNADFFSGAGKFYSDKSVAAADFVG
jgi:hypothetical protein